MKMVWIAVVLLPLPNPIGLFTASAQPGVDAGLHLGVYGGVYETVIASARQADDSQARPPVSEADIRIVQRAKAILNSEAKWNRADTRVCPKDAATFSLYCALEIATQEVSNHFEHRGAAMQEARFVIDEDLAKGNHYEHRLKDYNNDPKTTFADVQRFFQLLEDRIRKRLAQQASSPAQ
jgi:hypothetical protein